MSPSLTAPAPAAQPTTGTPEYIRAAYARAFDRATAARLVAYKNGDGSYDVPSTSLAGQLHTVSVTGRRWYDLRCTCRAGNQIACLHRAVAVFARKHHVSAVRPVIMGLCYCGATATDADSGTCPECAPRAAAAATRTERCPHGDWPEEVCIVCDVRPRTTHPLCKPDLAPSTPEEVAYSARLRAEVVHQFATGSPTLLATRGVDPLAEAYA